MSSAACLRLLPAPHLARFRPAACAASFTPSPPNQSWVLAALEDEERARVYYAFAALYAVPLLHSGFDIDGFSITMLAVGAAHVQVSGVCWPPLFAALWQNHSKQRRHLLQH
jgi:hypothetical protein